VGQNRTGVIPGEPAVELAHAVIAEGLRLRGLMGYEGHVAHQVEGFVSTTYLCGCVPFETIERAITETGVERTILSTDLGQPETPPPAEGLRLYAERLRSTGFSVDQIRTMMQANPERLLAPSKSNRGR